MLKSTLASLILICAAPAFAAPSVSDLKEEVRFDKQTLRDQRQDLREMKRLKKQWARAVALEKHAKTARLDAQLEAWMAEELKENKRSTYRAKQEFLAMGGSEAALQPEVHARYGKVPKVVTPKRAEDDRQDFIIERGHTEQTMGIVDGLRGMQPAFDAGINNEQLLRAKARLIRGLEIGAERDVKRAKAELEEDRTALKRRR